MCWNTPTRSGILGRGSTLDIDQYLYLVPFVTSADGTRFLKTIIPSRKATRDHKRRQLS